jgi:hypothetical protein
MDFTHPFIMFPKEDFPNKKRAKQMTDDMIKSMTMMKMNVVIMFLV